MLVVAQFPIADLRPFLPEPARRSRPKKWPPHSGIPPQFVHAFGPALERQRGADWAWLDERVYCRADRALRFPRLPVESGGWKENLRCAFRRLLCDGQAVARVEVGLSWIPEDERSLLWRYWDKSVKENMDPTDRLEGAQADINPLEVVRHVVSIPTLVRAAAPGEAPKAVARPLIRQGRALSELYWRATTIKKNADFFDGAVLHGAPVMLIECRSHWISKLPGNFVRVNPASAAHVNLAFGRINTEWGPLGVWVLGYEKAYLTESRSLRLCLLRLHAEQEVLDAVLGQLADGKLDYRASEPIGDIMEAYFNRATNLIFQRRRGGVEQSAVLTAFDAAEATDYRPLRAELAERLKGARKQIRRKLERFERRAYVRAERFIQVDLGATYIDRVENMTNNRIINIGKGATISAPVIIADQIQHSFNVLEKSSVNPEVKALITDLIKQVAEASQKMPEEKAKQVGSDAEALATEVASGAPRKRWYELSIDGLREAATAVGEVGKPILETTAKLLPLLISLFP